MICTKCGNEKDIKEFAKSSYTKSGYKNWCRACNKQIKDEWNKTLDGVIQTIWDSQRSSCKDRGHPLPSYTKEEFFAWMKSQDNLISLYEGWINSNYNRWYKPSVDRLDVFKSYSFDNIQLVTWGENIKLAHQSKAAGTANWDKYKPVVQFNLETKEVVKEYLTLNIAARESNIPQPNIWKVCNKQRLSAGGFYWEYKQNNEPI